MDLKFHSYAYVSVLSVSYNTRYESYIMLRFQYQMIHLIVYCGMKLSHCIVCYASGIAYIAGYIDDTSHIRNLGWVRATKFIFQNLKLTISASFLQKKKPSSFIFLLFKL